MIFSAIRRHSIAENRMFWNLVATHYEKYRLHHFLLFSLLLVYSFVGAVIFCALEGENETYQMEKTNREKVWQSIAAKKLLVDRIQRLFFQNTNQTDFYETKLRKAIDDYDFSMEVKVALNKQGKWDLWGGLYYAGTIYTTIGYGDLAAVTFWGRIFTIIYALFGVPMVITLLNDWGTLMFQAVEYVWKRYSKNIILWFKKITRPKNKQGSAEDLCEEVEPIVIHKESGEDEQEPIPLFLVVVVLVFWYLLCTGVFCYFEGWSFFESLYFFFISLTTIGFGDVTPSHRVAVANFLLILIGLSVVSMSINVVQMQLEIIFAKIVKSIEQDFKMNLSISAEENKRTANVDETGDVERGPSTKKQRDDEGDVVKQFGQGMAGTERFLMKFMSNHQRKMLNDKFEERAKMRNKWTQTTRQIKVASVQTADKYDDLLNFPEEEEEPKVKSRINARRLYIYNTGE